MGDDNIEKEEPVEEEEATTEETEEEESKEESEEEEDKEEKSSDDAPGFENFLKAEDVPEQLRGHHKKMVEVYNTEKKKLYAEIKRIENELGTKFSKDIIKSKALEQLAQNPNFQLLYADLEANRPYGYSSVFNKGGKVEKESQEEDDEPETKKGLSEDSVSKLVEREVSRRLRPILESRAKDTYQLAEKNLKNFARYKPAITEILQDNPNMSLEQAYKLASYDDRVSEAERFINQKDENDVKRVKSKPRSEKGSSGRTDTLSEKVSETVGDAIRFALSKQK